MSGPYFEDLEVGARFDSAPAVTLTDGHAAVHQAILGDRMRLPLDKPLSMRVAGRALAHPALVWNLAIGQSTEVTRHVKANLFYRDLVLRRLPAIGDTLRTTTTVAALRENQRRPGRAATGLAALRIVTLDQQDRPVLDFHRCAMLPLRDGRRRTGHRDDLDGVGGPADTAPLLSSIQGWDLEEFTAGARGPRFTDLTVGTSWSGGVDVVSGAPELARLTLNIAEVHHDATAAGGRRLVYGGHTIGLALAQVTRALPGLATVLGWHSCEHTGPVYEGDTLRGVITVERVEPLSGEVGMVDLRVRMRADDTREVLDWRLVALLG